MERKLCISMPSDPSCFSTTAGMRCMPPRVSPSVCVGRNCQPPASVACRHHSDASNNHGALHFPDRFRVPPNVLVKHHTQPLWELSEHPCLFLIVILITFCACLLHSSYLIAYVLTTFLVGFTDDVGKGCCSFFFLRLYHYNNVDIIEHYELLALLVGVNSRIFCDGTANASNDVCRQGIYSYSLANYRYT